MRKLLSLTLALACAALLSFPAAAQSWPSTTLRLVVPTPPGSSVDLVARVIGEKLKDRYGQTVIVENRPGAGGTIGAGLVAKATDGHTFFAGFNGPLTVAPALYPKLPYDPARDLAPVILTVTQPNVLAVRADLKVDSLKDFIALAKARPGKLNYASVGNGSLSHLSMELLKTGAGLFIVHIPFNGGPPAVQAMASGDVDALFTALSNLQPLARAGKVRLIALSNAKRSAAAPEIPTVAEQGFAGFDATTWNGILAPAATPPAVIAELNRAINQILALPEVQSRLLASGAEPAGGTPEQFGALMMAESERWAGVIRRSGIKPD
jgi:tripartite-type tricarboxylate transporter receptor subunit TctC